MKIHASQEEYGSRTSQPGRADDEGRIGSIPSPASVSASAPIPPAGSPYLARSTKPVSWQSGQRANRIDVQLPRGVWAGGTVIETGTGQPLAGALVQYLPEGADNPNASDEILTGWQQAVRTDEYGHFQIAVFLAPAACSSTDRKPIPRQTRHAGRT